jgi:dTDP-4-dehydrorhamnose reductase
MIRKIEGVYNLGSKNKISKAKFASLLGSILNCDLDLLNEIKYNNKYLVARRPLDMSLNINNFEKNTRIKLPYVLDEIEKLAKEYK